MHQQSVRTRPLTIEQQNGLRMRAMMMVALAVAILVVSSLIFACLLAAGGGNSGLLIAFVALGGLVVLAVVVALGIIAFRSWQDLGDGVAQVRALRLKRTYESARAPKNYYAEFDDFGSVLVVKEVYEQLQPGQVYVVTFSPRTRRGWSVEAGA